jgi:hypothetical protein
MNQTLGAYAAWCNIAASFAAFGIGITIMLKGGAGGASAIVVGPALLFVAEVLKLVMALCLLFEAKALHVLTGHRLPLFFGIVTAILIAIAGSMGICAVLSASLRALGGYVNQLASASLVASSLWALTSVVTGWPKRLFPTWAATVGILLAISSVAAMIAPAFGLGAFVLGVIWHTAVGLRLGEQRSRQE